MSRFRLYDLNPEQQRAATHESGPLLILAGAGTGKTRTIVARITWLVSTGVDPAKILAVTFTNKAAREMKEILVSISYVNSPACVTLLISTGNKFTLYLDEAVHIIAYKEKNETPPA